MQSSPPGLLHLYFVTGILGRGVGSNTLPTNFPTKQLPWFVFFIWKFETSTELATCAGWLICLMVFVVWSVFVSMMKCPSKFALFETQGGQRYCWWKKTCTSWYGKNPMIYMVLYIPGGAGFLPSTVWNMLFRLQMRLVDLKINLCP